MAEITLIINNFNESEKDRGKELLYSNYNLACMIASFVNRGLAGKDIPDIYEMYPDLDAEAKEQRRIQQLQTQMMNFANMHNNKIKQKGE